jgi:hypothetical protein
MIELYLEQTPPLVIAMKKSMLEGNWDMLHTAVHKMIPSFSIMGISKEYETMAKNVQEYKGETGKLREIQEYVLKLEQVCTLACKELEEEYKTLKNTKA